jgi:hypothetical protein
LVKFSSKLICNFGFVRAFNYMPFGCLIKPAHAVYLSQSSPPLQTSSKSKIFPEFKPFQDSLS